jgi:protein-S-isoprenylcysteine O-methyltransferase Ste14
MVASNWTRGAATLFVVGWAALAFASIRRFRLSKTSIVPVRAAEALVVTGPYAYTRNPMYVGLALLTIACGLFLAMWWPIILLLPTLAIVDRLVILPEERYLRRRFGDDYEAYTRRVRRWL